MTASLDSSGCELRVGPKMPLFEKMSREVEQPDEPVLDADEAAPLAVGDRIVFTTGENAGEIQVVLSSRGSMP